MPAEQPELVQARAPFFRAPGTLAGERVALLAPRQCVEAVDFGGAPGPRAPGGRGAGAPGRYAIRNPI